jgi:essential nuclear protein 1
MPKVKKIRSAALESRAVRQEPLGQVVAADTGKCAAPSSSSRNNKKEKNRSESSSSNNNKGGVTALLDTKASQRILQLSQEQQLEIQAEEMMTHSRKQQQQQQDERKRAKQYNMDSDEDEDDDDDIHRRESENGNVDDDDDDLIQHDDQGYVTLADGALGLSAEDEALVAAMMRPPTQERRTLADIILEKIEEKEAAAVRNNNTNNNSNMQDDDADDGEPELPPKVVQVYTEIGKILSRYTAGKLPKAFKVIPSLSNWEQVLYLTRPDMWTPQAMYQATRIFASNLNPKMAQRFYHFVLLDAVRADITTNKKLNYHYYLSLKKSVYKPAAFFKGILLPLCQDGANCTLREAAILASVLQRVSIPVHHSAVAIHKLATMSLSSYNGATSIFIKTLLNKKYSLPAPVIASLVQHFTSFIHYNNGNNTTTDSSSSSCSLPVLWHQALLVFVQRYKNELQKVAREALSAVMKKHYHYKITPEIRRELYGAQAYKDERAAAMTSSNNNKSTATSITSTGGGSGHGGSSMQVE